MQRFFSRLVSCAILALLGLIPAARLTAQPTAATSASPYEISPSVIANDGTQFTTELPHAHTNGQGHAANGITAIDSLPNFNGHFHIFGYDRFGNPQTDWYTNTVGRMPGDGGTTTIPAPIIPVSVELLDPSGNQAVDPSTGAALYDDATPDIQPALNSPVFQNSTYSSSPTPTQFTDALMRAQFYRQEAPSWHTILAPSVKTTRVIQVPYGYYYYALNQDGTCCFAIALDERTFINLLFPATSTDTTTPVGAAENAGEMTTTSISTLLLPDTLLFRGSISRCCIAGFHTYDYEPGDSSNGNVEKRYVTNYSGWFQPGLWLDGTGDVTPLSHEMSEIFNDPFVFSDSIHDLTPWWLSANGQCQDNLEVGDVVERLPKQFYPITMNGMIYHLQNEALLQWFEGKQSDAIDGAYSYPNESVLTNPMVSQKPFCQ